MRVLESLDQRSLPRFPSLAMSAPPKLLELINLTKAKIFTLEKYPKMYVSRGKTLVLVTYRAALALQKTEIQNAKVEIAQNSCFIWGCQIQ